MSGELLSVQGLRVGFGKRGAVLEALRDVSFTLAPGKTLALVGESGSGKSVSSLAIMGLLPKNGHILAGQIGFRCADGQVVDLATADEARRRSLRGAEIAMIFQEPMSSLNPLFTVGDQIGEMLLLHTDLDAAARRQRVIEMLELVEIPAAATRLTQYPHELSGGMRQRVMIALAMVCKPRLLIADEPTTALDVTVQAQIMELLAELQRDFGMAMVLITHDLGVIAGSAERVMVMYGGRVMERAPVDPLFADPAHPYTQGLLAAIPRVDQKGDRLSAIPGSPPNMTHPPAGCPFAPRCAYVIQTCRQVMPPLDPFADREPGRQAGIVRLAGPPRGQ